MKNNITIEQLLPKIKEIIDTISNGRVVYLKGKLSSLKNIIITSDKSLRDKICYNILSLNIFDLLQKYIEKEPNNKPITINIGEILFLLFSTVSNGLNKSIKSKWKEYNQHHSCINKISKILLAFTKDNKQEIQLFLKVYLRIIEWEMQSDKGSIDFLFHLQFINTLLDKHKDDESTIPFILEVTQKIINHEGFIDDYYSEDNTLKEKKSECDQLIQLLLLISTEVSKSEKNIIKSIHCLNYLMAIPSNIEIVRNEAFIIPLALMLQNYSSNMMLPIQLRSFLLKIINKDDLFILIEIIKANKIKDVYVEELNYKITKEIKEQLLPEKQETFNRFKQSALNIILLLLKERSILLILRDLNTLESLVHSLKYFTMTDQENSKLYLQILMQIIIWLAHSYDEENVEGAELSNSLQRNILCLSMKWIMYIDDEQVIQEIMAFFLIKAKTNFKEIISDDNHKQDLVESSKVFFTTILNKFYFHHWVFNFIYNLPITAVFCIDSIDFDTVCNELFNDIRSIYNLSNGSLSEHITKVENTMNALTLKLSLGIHIMSEDKQSFQLTSTKSLFKLFELIIGANKSVFEKSHSINQIISFMFSTLENKSNIDEKEKCSNILQFINKLTLRNQINDEIIQYLTIKLSQIASMNNSSIINMLFTSEVIVTFVIHCVSYPNITPKLAEGIMNILLLTLTTSVKNKAFILQLFCQNGLLKIMKIGSNPQNQSIKFNKIFEEILQLIKTKYIEQLFDFCSDDLFIQEYICLIKQISFSSNSLNEYCYLQILDIFFISVSNQEFSKEIIETTQLVDYFVKEAGDIFNFYSNTFHPLLVALIQILAVIFSSVGEMIVMITPKLFQLIYLILNQMRIEKNKGIFDLDNLNNLVKILVKINIKETECVYHTDSYKEIIQFILSIVFEDNVYLKEDCINLCLSLFEKCLKIEEVTFSKNDNLFTIAYFKELVLKFPRSNKKIKSKMDNLALMIEKEKIRKHDIIEEYSEIEKTLSSMNSKKRINPIVRGKRSSESTSKDNLLDETANQLLYQRRRTSVNISSDPTLQKYYNMIRTTLKSLLITINEKKSKEERIENECELISKLVQILKIFARDRDNCQKVYGKELMNILIGILNMKTIYSFPKNEVYLLLNKVVEQIEGNNEEFNFEELLHNASACNYFIKEIISIKINYNTEVSDLIYNKTLFITNILAKLSLEQSIIETNVEYLNVKELMIILKNVSNDHFIILNLMSVFNNIISLNYKDSIQYIKSNLEDFCKLMLETLWNAYKMDFRVIEIILKTIDNIKEEEEIIKEMLRQYDFKTKLNELLIEKSDATFMIILSSLLNSLMMHKYFADNFLDLTGVFNIIKASKVYKSYKSIIEKVLSIFILAIKFPNGGFIHSLGKHGVNTFCMFLFESFMNTCNDDIIKTVINIIQSLMIDDYNKMELSSKRNVETIQNLFIKNIENESMLIDISSILIKQITLVGDNNTPIKYPVVESNIKDKLDDNDEIEIVNYDLDLMMILVEKTLMRYNTNASIIKEIAKIARILFKQSNDNINKLRLFNCFLFFFNSYLELGLVESLEILINEINEVIEDNIMICIVNYLNNLISSIYQMFTTNSTHNKQIYNSCIEIMMKISKNNDSTFLLKISNLFPTLCSFMTNSQYHDESVLLNFSFILFNLFKSNPFEIPVDYLIFVLSYIDKLPPEKIVDNVYLQLLENTKEIADNYLIKEENEGKQTVNFLLNIFKANIENDNNIERIIMIIRKLLLHSNVFKQQLNNPELDFSNLINSFVKSIKGKNKMFLEYQGMSISCMLSSKGEEINLSSSQISTMEMKMSEQEINPEMKQFLSTSHFGKYYSETGDIKSVLLKMDDKLTYIQAIDRGMCVASMEVLNMESCVRSCSTPAFEKSKSIKNFFAKKPSAKKCFTIFGVKTLSGQNTFNVQCDTEDDCIKYVDYLSTLINNRKTQSK